jgi:hypothetical protein
MPHVTVDNLPACVEALDGTKAPGIDGVTKEMDGEHPEATLRALHQKLRQMSYRPQPVRRVDIPNEDGTMRPLGISRIEDKIVQELTRRILEAIDEPGFCETSYGFRPGQSCIAALPRLNREMMSAPVNWIADLALAQFFETMPHRDILAVLAERIKDRRFLRLIARMLKAGVQTLGGVVHEELGSPQGAIVSPVRECVLGQSPGPAGRHQREAPLPGLCGTDALRRRYAVCLRAGGRASAGHAGAPVAAGDIRTAPQRPENATGVLRHTCRVACDEGGLAPTHARYPRFHPRLGAEP